MRVALAFPGCHCRAGVERIMLECANYLVGRGHDVHAFSSDWDITRLAAGVARHHVHLPSGSAILRLHSFRRRCVRQLGSLDAPPQVLAGFGAVAPPGSVVWAQSVHAAWLEVSSRSRSFLGRLKQRLNLAHPYILSRERAYFAGRQYRKLIALSDTVKADLMRFYAVPASHIDIIPNGFSPTEFSLAQRATWRQQMRQSLGYSDGQRVVIFVANELERKGFGPLLRAIAMLRDPDVCLLAVGRLSAQAYAAEIARHGMTGRVRFTGPTGEVARYYAAADIFVLPTQYEAWGLVIVEAMACGLPALTSRLAGAAVAVSEGRTGNLLNDPNDVDEIATKLASLLAGRHEPHDVIASCVARYAWPCILTQYEQVLASVCAQASPQQW